jgi:hypothetical protein
MISCEIGDVTQDAAAQIRTKHSDEMMAFIWFDRCPCDGAASMSVVGFLQRNFMQYDDS